MAMGRSSLIMYSYLIFYYRYAVPLFVRIQREMKITSTFKQMKVDLVKEGFDPSKINDAIYYQDATQKTFVPLDTMTYQHILTGNSRL